MLLYHCINIMWYVSYCTAQIAICIVLVDSRIIPALGQTAEKAVWLGPTVFTILSSSFGCITVRVPCHTAQILESLQQFSLNVPCHEITARFVLCKFQMRNHPVGLDVWFLVGPFVYFHIYVCKQQRLWRDCADEACLSLLWTPMWQAP